MTANVIRADYDSLAQIAAQFAQESDQSAQMAQSVMVLVQQLESGAWIGMGANSFYSEMNDLVFPALRRLIDALCDAGESTRRISEMLRSAEEEAASLFKGRSEGAAAKAGAKRT
ncbi:MAG: WXG100 family type VII secretion target, partial [Anaerolinea sp.]|nr:WXG100 family type VII secretion target [Anaerolinea sp.]